MLYSVFSHMSFSAGLTNSTLNCKKVRNNSQLCFYCFKKNYQVINLSGCCSFVAFSLIPLFLATSWAPSGISYLLPIVLSCFTVFVQVQAKCSCRHLVFFYFFSFSFSFWISLNEGMGDSNCGLLFVQKANIRNFKQPGPSWNSKTSCEIL